jgi:transposase InsO family protein
VDPDAGGTTVQKSRHSAHRTVKPVPYLPRELRHEILSQLHDAPESGHMGVKKTQNEVKKRFYWNFMNKEIQTFVKTCQICQQYKDEKMKKKGLLRNVPVATAVFETLFIDFIGPLPTSQLRRNKFCLVVIDQLSSWVELFPMTAATARKVADKLENEVFCRFGSPKNIVSDNGSHFVNKIVKKLCEEWSIKHKLISAYHPCPNRAERTNADLVRMIASYLNDCHSNWDVHIQKFALVLPTMMNDTTQVSPALLNLGREIQLPIDRSLQVEKCEDYEEEARKSSQSIPLALKEIIKVVRNNIFRAHQVNKVYFDAKRRDVQFEVNQLVFVRNRALSNAEQNRAKKFGKKWIGPFKIISKFHDTYILDIPKRMISKRHVEDLKPYFPRDTPVQKKKFCRES